MGQSPCRSDGCGRCGFRENPCAACKVTHGSEDVVVCNRDRLASRLNNGFDGRESVARFINRDRIGDRAGIDARDIKSPPIDIGADGALLFDGQADRGTGY